MLDDALDVSADGSLYEQWAGTPTTVRLRYNGTTSAAEIDRRHREVERVLGDGTSLPDRASELADPVEADREYEATMARVIAKIRNSDGHPLVVIESSNYGYARNLYGLKRLGLVIAAGTFAFSIGMGAAVSWQAEAAEARPLVLPVIASLIALLLWPRVTPTFVRPNADAYADRVIEAAANLPPASSETGDEFTGP